MESSLLRSKKDKIITGVCGEIAEHFKIDPIVIRVVFVVAVAAAASSGSVGSAQMLKQIRVHDA